MKHTWASDNLRIEIQDLVDLKTNLLIIFKNEKLINKERASISYLTLEHLHFSSNYFIFLWIWLMSPILQYVLETIKISTDWIIYLNIT